MKSKVLKRIFDIQSRTNDEVAKVKADIQKAQDDAQVARDTMATTDDPEVYAIAKTKIVESDETVTVLNRRLKKVSKPLTDDDFRELREEIKSERQSINDDYAEKINSHLTSALRLFEEYEGITKDYAFGMFTLEDLADRDHVNKIKPVDIAASIHDPDGWFGALCLWYFAKREKVNMIRHVQKTGVVPNSWK